MPEPIVSVAEIAAQAREAAREYLREGTVPMNPYPALSESARLFTAFYQRAIAGDEDEGNVE